MLLAAWTPRQAAPWRRLVLQAFGARLAATADVRGSAQVWYPPNLAMGPHSTLGPGVICYNMASVEIGARTMVSQRAHLCTGSHDVSDPSFQLVARRIVIESQSWIAAEAFVGPGVKVQEGAVLGARAATFDDLDPWWVYRGNPARPVKPRTLRPRESEPQSEHRNGNFSGSKIL